MTTWKDGGNLGRLDRVIINNTDEVCTVRIRRDVYFDEGSGNTRRRGFRIQPCPEGEANFRLILAAPQMMEALEAIRDRADDMMEIRDGAVNWTHWQPIRSIARAAIAAAKGENNDDIG